MNPYRQPRKVGLSEQAQGGREPLRTGTLEPQQPPAASLERARRLGHRVDRLVGPKLAPPPTAVQRLFSEGHARAFVLDRAPDPMAVNAWPVNRPPNMWNWFRTRPGVTLALGRDPRWRDDVDGRALSQERMELVLEGLYDAVVQERARRAEVARQEHAQELADNVPQNLRNHVFLGDFGPGGAPTGYHSKAGNSPTHEAYGGTTNVNGFGVYQQSVRGRANAQAAWRRKPIQSTFFPDQVGNRGATENDVNLALGTGRASHARQVNYPAEWRGMPLRSIGETWFPDGGDDRLAEDLP